MERKRNQELDDMIAREQALIPEAVQRVDVKRGQVSKALGQTMKNRKEAIKALESQKELSSVDLKAGI